jgi:hypothetical protein
MKNQCLQKPAEPTRGKKVSLLVAQGSGHSSFSPLAPLTLLPSCHLHLCVAEIIMFDDNLVVYKQQGDLMFYVTGSLAENELILYSVLQAFYEATAILLR